MLGTSERESTKSWLLAAERDSGERTAVAARKVLIVEDEPLIAWALADMIRQLGYEVVSTVATENAAVEEADRLVPDAILMDFRLAGGGSGLAAARRIRETHDMPIVFCTAYAEEAGLRAEMLALPRATLVAKPVFPANLRRALAQTFDEDS